MSRNGLVNSGVQLDEACSQLACVKLWERTDIPAIPGAYAHVGRTQYQTRVWFLCADQSCDRARTTGDSTAALVKETRYFMLNFSSTGSCMLMTVLSSGLPCTAACLGTQQLCLKTRPKRSAPAPACPAKQGCMLAA